MASNRITEKAQTREVKHDASVLITQLETVNGRDVESLRRTSLSALAAALESFHGSGSSGDNVTVPSYWLKQLEARAKYIRTAMINAGWNKSAFLFYTDAHWTYNNKQSPALLKWLYKHTPINKVAFGGDIIDNEGEVASSLDYLWEWRSALRGLEHHSVPGNHDDGNDPDNRWTDADVYTFLLAPEETPYVMRGGALYYYIDEPAEKTRYLYLDTATKDGMIINDPGQQKWLKDTLLSTPDGWHIVAIAHIWAVPDYSVTPPTAGTLGSNAVYLLEQFDKYNARTGDYASCGGRVEFCIGGHNHRDSDYTSENGIPVILVQTDSKHVRDGGVSTAGTTQENSVNAIVADYTNGIVSVVRVGRGNGRIVSLDGSGSIEIPDDGTGTNTPVVPDAPIDNSWMDTSITRLLQTSNDTVGIEWKDNVSGVTYVIYDNGKEVARKADDTQAVIFNVSAGEHSYTVRPQKSSSEIGNHSEEKTIITIADVGFTNVLRISTDTDGVTLYNGGYGYKNDVRIKSDNTEVAASGWDVTGYVPVSPGAVIRMHNVRFTRDPDELGTETSRASIFLFDSSRKPIIAADGNNACLYFYRGTTTSGALAAVTDEDGDYIQFTIPASWYPSVGYIRIAADDITCTSIITVNEEIPDIAPQMFCTSDGSTFIASDNDVFYVKGGS